MLVGQDIGLAEVVWISLFGMTVATIAIILLMIFVIIMSKIISQGKKATLLKKNISEKATLAQTSPTLMVMPRATVTEDEVASITAALYMETGMRPEQLRIVSITGK